MKELRQWAQLEAKAAEDLLGRLKRAVTITTVETRNSVVEKEPVYKGFLTNGTMFKAPIVQGTGFISKISGEVFLTGNVSVHGNVQDLGRTQGARMPPHPPLRRWIQLRVDRGQWELDPRRSRRAAINQAAFLVRRKISRDPAPGIQFFERSLPQAQANLDRRVQEASDETARQMES